MASIKIIDWNTVKKTFTGKTIAQLDNVDVATASLSEEPKLSIKGVALSFGASAKFFINAYNETTDTDDEQIVGVPGSKTADGGTLDPKIPFVAENAWLRYTLAGELSAAIKAKLTHVGIGVEAESQIVFSDYRVHKPADAADESVLADLVAPRTALNLADVLSLGKSEALYYELRGSLAFSVSVSYSDIYTKTLSQIASELPATKAFAIDIEVGANVSFKVTLTDDFTLVFWRDAAGALHVGVRKAASRGFGLAAGFSVEAKFADPAAVTKLGQDFLKGYFGESLETIDDVLNKATGGNLNDVEKKIFDRVAKLLHLDATIKEAAKVKAGLDQLVKDVNAKIEVAANTQIGASWKYEYSRVESTQFVVEAVITEAQLSGLHASLVEQDVQPLLADSSIALTKYLDETTVVRKHSLGFSLGIGKWFQIGDHDEKQLTIRTRRTRDKKRSMISYIGARKFGGGQNWSIGEYAFDFRAEMADYAASPIASDFDFGLALMMRTQPQKLTDEGVAAILDTAAMWAIIDDGDADDIKSKLDVALGKTATAEYALTLDEDDLRHLMPIAGTTNGMARALAAAMPRSNAPARSSWKTRAQLYAPAWSLVLNENADFSDAFAAVKAAIKAADFPTSELDATKVTFATLRSLIEGHPKVVQHFNTWSTGAKLLAEAVGPGTMAASKLGTIFTDLYDFFSQVLYVRAIGRHLVDVAAATGHLGGIGRAATVTYTVGGKEKSIVIGSKA